MEYLQISPKRLANIWPKRYLTARPEMKVSQVKPVERFHLSRRSVGYVAIFIAEDVVDELIGMVVAAEVSPLCSIP